jgi:glycosyltransferase involved in cell wall biosynthesis
MEPRVTVLMAVHNCAGTVREAMESVLGQRFGELELVVVEDGSGDGTAEVVRSMKDERVRVLVNEKNVGLSRSLNRGWEGARGEFVARMDGDDVSLPERVGKQVGFMEGNPEVAVAGSFIETFGAGGGEVVRYPTEAGMVGATLLFRNALAHPAVMMRKGALDAAGLRYEAEFRCAQDNALWARCVAKGMKLANVGEVLLRYRVHGGQLSQQYFGGMHEEGTVLRGRLVREVLPGVTPGELAVHDRLSRDCLEETEQEVRGADRWLRRLWERNEEMGLFEREALGRVLCGRWVKVVRLGRKVGVEVGGDAGPFGRFLHAGAI